MKQVAFFTVLFFFMSNVFGSEWIELTSAKPGKAKTELISSSVEVSEISFSLDGFYFNPVETNKGKALSVSLDGATPIMEKGAPNLPKLTASVIIPDMARMQLEVISAEYKEFEDVEIAPSKGNLPRTIDPSTVPYEYGEAYEKDAFYPGKTAQLRKPYIIRDVRGQTVVVNPFQYNPVTKTLRVYYNIQLKLSEVDNNGFNQLVRKTELTSMAREFKQLYQRHFLNFNSMRYDPVDEEGSMLIVSYGDFMDEMQPFVDWKNQIGIPTQLVNVADLGGNSSGIADYVETYYNENDLAFLLLVGDADEVPSNGNGYGCSDNEYAYLEGNDSYPEFFVGRFSAQNEDHVITQVQKVLDYEQNPSMGEWYRSGIGVASSQGPGDDNEYDYEHVRNMQDDLLDFTYDSNPEFFDGSQGGNDAPGNPTPSMVAEEVNNGASVMLYTGHGSTTSWGSSGFSNNNINSLTNTGKLPFIWSVACVNGQFDGYTCFGEAWLRATDGSGNPTGAIATLMSTQNQSWNPPMEGQDEMVDILVESYSDNIKRTFGGISMNGCMQMNDTYGYDGADETDTWTVFGDPSLYVRTAPPTSLTVTHNPTIFLGSSQLDVNCDAEGARIALTMDGEILAVTYIEGGSATLEFEALNNVGMAKLTVFGFNHVPYIADIEVIPAEGPYVIYDTHAINDEAGNGNGMADYNESIMLDVSMENVGIEEATNVMVSLASGSDYVNITDDVEDFGTIPAEDIVSINDAFAFDVTDDVPDQEVIMFTLTATDGTEEWSSTFTITAHAPVLAAGTMVIDDMNGGNGNGRIDPGETFDLQITSFNEGTSDALDALGTLTSSSEYITINEGSYEIGQISAGGSAIAEFNATVDDEAPVGTNVYFDFELDAVGEYDINKQYFAKVGIILEDFETGDFTAFDWNFSGSADWSIIQDEVYEGQYAAKSGMIDNQENSVLEISLEDVLGDTISFYSKVSSESNYDYLVFYIDDEMMGEWSGEQDWEKHEYFVPAGDHTLKWAYEKDYSVSSGEDCAWVDYIEFPAVQNPVPPVANFEANTTTVYAGEAIDFTDLSTNEPNSWSWEFEGGTPASSTEQNPTGINYNTAGSFDVTLTVTNQYGSNSITMEDYITVMESHFDFEGGNPADPVYTMYLSGATIDGEAMEAYDEIAIYDGETMVGQFTLDQVCTPDNQFDNDLIAFSTVVSGNGYDPGNPIVLKAWDASEETEVTGFAILFENPYGDAWTEDYYPEADGEYSLAQLEFTTGGGMQQMVLNSGYQFVSSHMEPTDPDFMYLCEDLMYDETLDFIRNSEGSMVQKIGPNWVNNIGMWNTMEGYLFKMLDSDDFMMEGTAMDPTTPMPLEIGYKFISYLPASPIDAMVAVESIMDNLDFMRDSEGSMLQKIGPNWVNNIGDMNPGEGYLVKMNAADELTYPVSGTKSNIVRSASPSFYNFNGGNPADPVYTMYLETGNGIAAGDEVAAYQEGRLLGATTLIEGKATQNDLALFSTLTEGKGYEAGKAIELRLYDASENQEYKLNVELENPYGDSHMSMTAPVGDGAYSIARISKSTTGIGESEANFILYPNPANEVVNITAGTTIDRISVYDYTGKQVMETVPASNTVDIDVSNYESGIYVIRIETATATVNKQVVVR